MAQEAVMQGQNQSNYYFEGFRIDVEERLLYDRQSVVALTPKAFDTLLALVENSLHVLSKEELMEKVWPNTFVEENNLAQNISMLRKVLERKRGGQKFIETVPRRGYRFLAPVSYGPEAVEGAQHTWNSSEMQPGYNERPHMKAKLPLRDVVIIGRAIDFK